jgi:general nucleoside transport system permease protein
VKTATIAILVALAVTSALMLIDARSPLDVYALMLSRTWGDAYGIGQVLARATPLVFAGLAVAVPLRGQLFNVGGEGQMMAGALIIGVAGAHLPLPVVVAPIVCVLLGGLAGGVVGGTAGILKSRFGAHEVITTIMLNFVVAALLLWVGREWFFQPETVHTALIRPEARIPAIPGLGGSAASVAFFGAIAIAALLHVWFARSRSGFELGAVGLGPEAAETAGIHVARHQLAALTVGGALAGFAGSQTVLGYKGYFEEGLGSGAGFMGIAVCLVARGQPLLIVPAALLLATLTQGGLAANMLVPKEIVEVFQGVLVLALAIAVRRRA